MHGIIFGSIPAGDRLKRVYMYICDDSGSYTFPNFLKKPCDLLFVFSRTY